MSVILEVDANVILITETAKPQVKKHKRLFVICDDCYWCASALNQRYFDAVTCPLCGKQVSSIPLTDNESYSYKQNESHGVELDFWSDRQAPAVGR